MLVETITKAKQLAEQFGVPYTVYQTLLDDRIILLSGKDSFPRMRTLITINPSLIARLKKLFKFIKK